MWHTEPGGVGVTREMRRLVRRGVAQLVVAALVATLTIGCSGDAGTVTVTVSRAQLQQRLNDRFPVEHGRLLGRVTLANPRVILEPGSDRIGLGMDATVQIPVAGTVSGALRASAGLSYRKNEKAFYLHDLNIERVQVGRLDGDELMGVVKPVELAASSALTVFPVYTLRRRSLRELTTEHVLRSVRVHEGRLYLELGLPLY